MIDIETTKDIVKEFANKYNLIQQIDIEIIEKLTDFNEYIKNCYKLNGKKYIIMYEFQNRIEIQVGTIFINVHKDDEKDEEFYGIDTNRLFLINVFDFPDKDAVMEAIVKECLNKKLI